MPGSSSASNPTETRRIAWAVAVLALLPYLFLPANPLLYDGPIAILANESVQSGPLAELFGVDFWGMSLRAEHGTRSYRPLVSLTYALQARTLGNAASLYHAGDMLLHGAVSGLLVLLLAWMGIRRPWLGCAGLLFAWHPVLTDAVCSAVGRADVLAAGFLLGCLLLHLEAPGRRHRGVWQAAALGLLVCGFLSKEYAVSFPFLLLAVDLARRFSGAGTKAESRAATRVTGGAFVLLAGYLALRWLLIGALGGVPSLATDDHPLVGQPLSVRWGTASLLVPLALRLLVLPYGLNHHYRYGTLKIASGLLDARTLLGIALVSVLLFIAVWSVIRRRQVVPAVAIAFFLLPLGPTLNTVSLSGVLFAERFLYLPTCGLALGIGWVFQLACEAQPRRRNTLVAACSLVLVLFLGLTLRRVETWKSLESLARASLAAYPQGSEVWKQLGLTLQQQGRHRESHAALQRSIEINPANAQAWKHYADSLHALERYPEAVDAWRRTLELSPQDIGVLWRGRGETELLAGLPGEAARSLERAHRLMPEDPKSLYRLSQALVASDETDAAIRALREGTAARANDPDALDSLLVQMLLRQAQSELARGNHDRSIRLASEAAGVPGIPAEGLYLAGLVAHQAGRTDLSRTWLEQALAASPELLRNKHRLALELQQQGKLDEAVARFREILVARPEQVPTLFNLGRSLLLAGHPGQAVTVLERGLELQEDATARDLLRQARESAPRK